MTIDELVPGQILRNDEIVSIFQCAPQGGMRRSKRTNSLVLISDHTKALYEDRWEGDVFHYTGMGRVGDQKLDFQQNKTLAESTTNGVDLYLFEVFRENEYVFMGQVELADQPYQDQQLDIENNLRLVWIFPLKLKENTQPIEIPQEWIESKNRYREKRAKKLSDEELKARAKHTNKKAIKRSTSTTAYERNPYVSEYAKRWANGICQLCDQPAPFNDKDGNPYLETHHIEWLSRGGDDTIENTIALCPNCHRKMHILDRKADVEKLKKRVRERLSSLA
ncbi:HNH endonuclease [Geobacillus stearothermophilus]|jgi:5-methylcytosine-specific restriction protein A|uniref:HNH endonuclease n=1 Tax=Geobacillus stearothermophilus TaxID=1422 RepID=UPI003D20CDFA